MQRRTSRKSDVSWLRTERVMCRGCVSRDHRSACGKFCTIYQDCTLILQSAKMLEYHQNIKIPFSIQIAKYRLYRRQIQRLRRHFSGFFRDLSEKTCGKCVKTSKIAEILRTRFWKVSENREILRYLII